MMWKSEICWALGVLGAATFFVVVEGLNCYSCFAEDSLSEYNIAGEGLLQGSTSCKWGSTPNDTLKRVCPVVKDDEGKEIQPACLQLFAQFQLSNAAGESKTFNLTYRQCALSTAGFNFDKEPECSSKTLKQLDDMKLLSSAVTLGPMAQYVPESQETAFCICTSDHCNQAAAPGGIGAGKIFLLGGILAAANQLLLF